MKKVNKKIIISNGIVLIIIIGFIFYFTPLNLSKSISKDEDILFTHIEMKIDNGVPLQNSKNYDNLTEKKSEILTLLQKYPYRKMLKTMISDGSLSGLGDNLIYMYTYNNERITNEITIASLDNISINGKAYKMNNTKELIVELLKLINN